MWQKGIDINWRELELGVWNQVKALNWVYETWRTIRTSDNWVNELSSNQKGLLEWLTK